MQVFFTTLRARELGLKWIDEQINTGNCTESSDGTLPRVGEASDYYNTVNELSVKGTQDLPSIGENGLFTGSNENFCNHLYSKHWEHGACYIIISEV